MRRIERFIGRKINRELIAIERGTKVRRKIMERYGEEVQTERERER